MLDPVLAPTDQAAAKYDPTVGQAEGNRRGTAEKTADMFQKKAEMSFMQDIVPVILEKCQYQPLNEWSCAEASEDISRALDIAIRYGHIIKCVPQFKPTLAGVMEMVDIIYKRILS